MPAALAQPVKEQRLPCRRAQETNLPTLFLHYSVDAERQVENVNTNL